MGWDRHKLLWDGMGQKNMSHGQACESITFKNKFVEGSISFKVKWFLSIFFFFVFL